VKQRIKEGYRGLPTNRRREDACVRACVRVFVSRDSNARPVITFGKLLNPLKM